MLSSQTQKTSSRIASVASKAPVVAASSTPATSGSTQTGPAHLLTPKKRMATNGMGIFACLDDKGKVYVWGNSNLTKIPVDLPPLVDIALGQDFAVGLDASGKLYSWGDLGYNDHGQTTFGNYLPPFIEVEASAYHTAALTADGKLYKWGNGNSGSQKDVAQNLGTVKRVEVDAYVTAVITSDDKIVRWGVSPKNVFSSTYSMVSCSWYDVYGLGKDGKVYGSFTLGDGQYQAVQPPTVSNIVKISGSLALDSNGKVYAWGSNQLYSNDQITDVPVNLPKIIDITGAGDSGMALGEDGKIYTWGMGVERSTKPSYDFLSTVPNVYVEDPTPENKESISVKTYSELQTAVSNPNCKSITIEGNISISVNSFVIGSYKSSKDLTIASGSTLTIEATAGNTHVNGKLTVNGTILVKGRLIVQNDAGVTVTGSIIKQGGGRVITYLRDFTHFESLLTSEVFNEIVYTPGNPTTFLIERDITIPSGKTVWLNIFVTIKVPVGVTMTVNGQVQTLNTPIVEGKVVGTVQVIPTS